MKNLRKILLAVLILALVASVAVITVIAADGSVTIEDANNLWAAYTSAQKDEDKIAALEQFYAFVQKGELPDSTEGYEDLKKKYDEATFAFAKGYNDSGDLVALYGHLAKCPLINTAHVSGYDEFVTSYNTNSAKKAISLFSLCKNQSGPLYDAAQAYYTYMAERDFVTYAAPQLPTEYTGDVATALTKLEASAAATKTEDKMPLFAELYAYFLTVDPALEGYTELADAYFAECETMTTALMDSIAKEGDLASVKAYLVENPYSEAACNAYNVKVNSFAKNYADTAISLLKTAESKYSGCYSHTVSCPVNVSKLSDDVKADYEKFVNDADALEASIVYAYAVQYESAGEIVPIASAFPHIQKNVYFDQFNAAVKKYTFSYTAPNSVAINAKIVEVRADIERVNAEQKAITDYNTDLSEYAYEHDKSSPKTSYFDFEDLVEPPWVFVHGDKNKSANTGTELYIRQEENGNKYADFVYGPSNTDGYIDFIVNDSSLGIVIEFDITTFLDPKKTSMKINAAEWGLNPDGSRTGNRKFPVFLQVLGGAFANPWGSKVTDQIITAGEWTHVTLSYDPVDLTATLYVDYLEVATWSVASNELYKLTTLRFASPAAANQSYALDNIVAYPGTTFRITDKFEKMNNEEKFSFYIGYAYDQSKDPADRVFAYNKTVELYDTIKDTQDEALLADIARFNAFDYNVHILEPTRKENLEKLSELVEALIYVPEDAEDKRIVTSDNNENKREEAESIEAFIGECGNYINRSEAKYIEYKNIINSVKQECDIYTNVEQLVYYLQRFKRATTYASMKTYADAAAEYYKLCKFTDGSEDDAAYLSINMDKVVTLFEASVSPYNLVEYFLTFEGTMNERIMYENSFRIIDCMGYILGLDGYENTEEFWKNNFDYINKYVLIVRDVVRSSNYDPDYAGVDEAIEAFELIDSYFYELLQDRHVLNIKAQIDKYPLTDSYIEKVGIVRYISDYIRTNDVDMTRADLAELLFLHSVYENEVEIHKNEYAALLVQNTTYFVYTVQRMGAYVTYTELKPLYDEALTYYYSINLESDEAVAAVDKFHEYEQMLLAAEVSSAMFIGAVDAINAADGKGELYEAIVKCQKYFAEADESIEGVSDAITKYEKALADYTAATDAANEQIAEANSVVCSVRTMSIAEAILAALKNVFTR